MTLEEFTKETGITEGSYVQLLHSKTNWDPPMSKIVDELSIVIVTKLYQYSDKDIVISFEGDKGYTWCFQHGHFCALPAPKPSLIGLKNLLTKLNII